MLYNHKYEVHTVYAPQQKCGSPCAYLLTKNHQFKHINCKNKTYKTDYIVNAIIFVRYNFVIR